MRTDGRTDGHDLQVIFAFRSFANAPKNESCLKKATGIKNPPHVFSFVWYRGVRV
jgi:hypothetical protein